MHIAEAETEEKKTEKTSAATGNPKGNLCDPPGRHLVSDQSEPLWHCSGDGTDLCIKRNFCQ